MRRKNKLKLAVIILLVTFMFLLVIPVPSNDIGPDGYTASTCTGIAFLILILFAVNLCLFTEIVLFTHKLE